MSRLGPDVRDGAVALRGFHRPDAVRHGPKALAEEIPGAERVKDKMEPMPTPARTRT